MCVIVRSAAASMPIIRRAFAAARIPLDLGIDEPAVGSSTAVRSLVDIVRLAFADEPDAAAIEAAAAADPKIAELLAGKTIVKVVAVPGRMVNFVVK